MWTRDGATMTRPLGHRLFESLGVTFENPATRRLTYLQSNTMMDAIVQLLRNGLCCVKNLHLFEKTFLWDSTILPQYYEFPEPLNQTTPLEVMISIFQLYALISLTRGGLTMMVESFGKLRRVGRIIEAQSEADDKKTKKSDDNENALALASEKIVQQSLLQEANNAIRNVLMGFLVFYIGACFFWLVANSWHVTSTDWIGGVQGLIHALSVQEFCLLPCLCFMITNGQALLAKAKRIETMVRNLRGQKKLEPTKLSLEELELICQWKPFWEAGGGLLELHDARAAAAEEKLVISERNQVVRLLQELGTKKAGHVLDLADDLLDRARVTRMEGYREFLYFVLNLAAFYGYMMGIVCFYWQEEAAHPSWVRNFLFNMTVADADWRGNMAGDSAWTIEPIVILTSPLLLERSKAKKTKITKAKTE